MGSLHPKGVLEGVFSSFGEYDECLDIESPPGVTPPIRGQYCMVKPIIPLPPLGSSKPGEIRENFTVSWLQLFNNNQYQDFIIEAFQFYNFTIVQLGLCIPSNCRPHDIENAINKGIKTIN